MFREAYDAKTPTIIVDDIKVLDPVLILNAKCGSVFRRSTDDKRKSDAFDILFLLQYLLDHQAPPLTRAVLSSVDQHFMAEILRWLPDSQPFWKGLGYDFELGRFPDDVEPAEGQTST
ncbi:MAG: hypothetical protein M1826_001627 [Phylliscum demangeonii]|nr:MAG: hypothetical protein M1826_001627 [Phylliscum demangeonii]